MPYSDLREYIYRLEREKELQRVSTEVDWNLEIGAITRRALDLRAPAPLFESIKGYPKGYRVLGNLLGPTNPVTQGRFSLSMDLPKDTPTLQVIDEFGDRIKKPLKPKRVKSGPCKENVKTDSLDLLEFPIPLIHQTDGGRYIGTWHVDVTKDPEEGWVNWGMYRHMLHDKETMGWDPGIPGHAYAHYRKYEGRDEEMPFAMAIGTEPVSSIVAGAGFPWGVEERDMAGAIRGKPIEVVKCETVDLDVPATSEIVIEGIVKPHERRSEGPFGEWTGYCTAGARNRLVVHVTCISHREDPILTISNMGKPWDECGVIQSITQSANIASELRSRGLPFKSVYTPPPVLAVIVSTKSPYPGFEHTLASAIWSSRVAVQIPYIIVVDEDVDVTSFVDVFWCLTSRMHPYHGITVESGTPSHELIPFLTPTERKRPDQIRSHRALFNATFPPEWPNEMVPKIMDFEHAWPPEVREKVLTRWKEYGLE
jgi:4-hydroxy-3-polyprenylbenzoate decarboxylase